MKQKRMDNDHPSGVLQNRMPDSVNQKVSTHDQVRRVGNTMLCLLISFFCILAGGYTWSICLIFSTDVQSSMPSLPNVSQLYMEDDSPKNTVIDPMIIAMPNKIDLAVEPIMQLPELPLGCEITALATLLQYYGFSADKVMLCEQMLDFGLSYADPFEGYVGSPFEEHGGFGCYAPPIVRAANRYFAQQNSALSAYDVSGTSFDILLEYVMTGTPVMVWTTQQTLDSDVAYTYGEINWYRLSHCVVISGFEGDAVICADPLEGTVRYDRSRMEQMYKLLYAQAVLIR